MSDDQPKLFERIDASKLQGAISNAAMMGHLEVRQNINCVCIYITDLIWLLHMLLKYTIRDYSRLKLNVTKFKHLAKKMFLY